MKAARAEDLDVLFDEGKNISPIALGATASGEENFFNILGMNPHQRIHAYYLAGGDHYHRYHPGAGQPDTI
jgi:hypothetical protein